MRPTVLLVGGTSHVGKSTVARAMAADLGWRYQSTDRLARHPGRPWTTDRVEVHQHYARLTVDRLTDAQLRHYELMWPTIEALVLDALRAGGPGGLVLEGSGIWPDRVAGLPAGRVGAVWLIATPELLRRRVLAQSGFADRTEPERAAVLRFAGRTEQYNARLLAALSRLGQPAIDVSDDPPVDQLADRIRHLTGLPPPTAR